MALPGDHQVRQFARAEWEDIENYTGPEGEIVIDLTNKRIVLHDGETPGGHAFLNRDDISGLVGGDATPEGSVALAQAGVDTLQRTWPAVVFALFARQDNANLTGTPTTPTPPNDSNNMRIANTAWVTANFAPYPSQSGNINEGIFPINHHIIAMANEVTAQRCALPANALKLDAGTDTRYTLGGSGGALAGTWRINSAFDADVVGSQSYVLISRRG